MESDDEEREIIPATQQPCFGKLSRRRRGIHRTRSNDESESKKPKKLSVTVESDFDKNKDLVSPMEESQSFIPSGQGSILCSSDSQAKINSDDDASPSGSQHINPEPNQLPQFVNIQADGVKRVPAATIQNEEIRHKFFGSSSRHVNEFNPNFVLVEWGFTKSIDSITLECSKKNIQHNIILGFLSGQTPDMSLNNFLSFLDLKPDNIFGTFIIALMITDYAVHLSTNDLLHLFEQRHMTPTYFRELIKHLVIFQLQIRIQHDLLIEEAIDILPNELKDDISLDFISYLTNKQDIGVEFTSTQKSNKEEESLSSITDILIEMMFNYLENHAKQEIEELSRSWHLARVWTPVVYKYMNKIRRREPVSFFGILLLEEKKTKTNKTKVYLTICDDDERFDVRIHPEVISRFAKNPRCSSDDIIEATREDVEVLNSLLYLNYDLKSYKGKISYGVFKMTKQLNIDDMKYFLFRGNDYHLFLDETNKKDMFHILLGLSQVDAAAVNFKNWFTEQNQSKSLNGLPAEIVISFLECKTLQLSQLEVYKILVQWSFADCGKCCGDELKTPCDNDVYESFKKVRKVLRLVDLRQHFPQMYLQKFITVQDIKDANTIAFCHDANNSVLPQDTWFSIDSG